VNLNDSPLDKQYQEYDNRLLTIKNLSYLILIYSVKDDQVLRLKINIEFFHGSKASLVTLFICKKNYFYRTSASLGYI